MVTHLSILELLDLEHIEENIYRSCVTFTEAHPVRRAGCRAGAGCRGQDRPAGRLPHSLHGYFLRAGDTRRPTLFRVDRDSVLTYISDISTADIPLEPRG